MQRVCQQGKLTNDVQERLEAIGQAVSARRDSRGRHRNELIVNDVNLGAKNGNSVESV